MLDDILLETPAFQDIMRRVREIGLKVGREVGLELGRQEGIKEGQLEAFRRTLLHIAEVRFPELTQLAKRKAAILDDPEELDGLIIKIGIARDIDEARRYLLGEEKEEDSD